MRTRKENENELMEKMRRIIAWERTHILPDISSEASEMGT